MDHSEKEAKELICPYLMSALYSNNRAISETENMQLSDAAILAAYCKGSKCMAWRWSSVGSMRDKGSCGLARA